MWFLLSDESVDSFNAIVQDLWPILDVNVVAGGRPHKLNVPNRVLLLLIWLKTYPPLYMLALLFDVTEMTVSREIKEILPLMWNYCHQVIKWPTVNEWRAMHNTFDFFPNCVAMIDGTVHEVQHPRDEGQQREVYDGHHHYHNLSTQVICDVKRNIRYIHTGFEGRLNDAGQYILLPQIGYQPQDPLQFPQECYMLADKGYANRYPLVTPYRANQMIGNQQQVQAMQAYNTEHAAHRMPVEHVMRHIKTYRSVGQIFRHELNMMPLVADVAAFLGQRNLALINNLH